jgi:hypothetical protein
MQQPSQRGQGCALDPRRPTAPAARPGVDPVLIYGESALLVTSADFPDSVLTVDLDNDNQIEVIRLTRNPSRQARPSSQPLSRRRRGVAARRLGSSAPAEPKLAKGDWRAYRRVGARLSRTPDSRPYRMFMHCHHWAEHPFLPPSAPARHRRPGCQATAARAAGSLRRAGGSLTGASVGDGLPDQLGHIDDQIGSGLTWIAGCANLAGADADRVVQPTVGLAVGQVKH